MSGSERALEREDVETARLAQGIEKTRADMSLTVAAIETRLRPSTLRAQLEGELQHVEDKVRQVVREQLLDAKALVKEELVEAKALLREQIDAAEAKIKNGLGEARDKVKEDVARELEGAEARLRKGLTDLKDNAKTELGDAITSAKQGLRAATLGKVEDIATKSGDIMNDTRDTLIDTIRNNPVPAALAGVGIAWLLMNRSSAARRTDGGSSTGGGGIRVSYRGEDAERGVVEDLGDSLRHAKDAAGSIAHQVGDAAGSLAHQASDAAGSLAHQASEAAGSAIHGVSSLAERVATRVADGARDASKGLVHGAGDASSYVASTVRSQARRVEHGYQSTMRNNPLALGAAAVAVGAVIGYALPSTHGEDALMGAARDEVLHRAEAVTHDAAGMVGQLAEQSLGAAKAILNASDNGSATASS